MLSDELKQLPVPVVILELHIPMLHHRDLNKI
jgi:hypothetical protein